MNGTNDPALENVIPLAVQPKPQPASPPFRQRFKILEFTNRGKGKSKSWRVTGIKRDGGRVRENYSDPEFARKRQAQLEIEYLARPDDPSIAPVAIRTTKLTDVQLRLCEAALAKLDSDDDLLPAVSHWLQHGKALAVKESKRLDEAVDSFLTWLDATETLRKRTKGKYKSRVNLFRNSVPNILVSDIRSDFIKAFFAKRKVRPRTKIGDREAISVFFEWCIRHDPQWTAINPCKGVDIEISTDGKEVSILSVQECQKILAKAQTHRRGRVAPYVAVCLFGGLRPTEAARLNWDKVNLKDGEIRIEAQSSKRKEPRVVTIGATLKAWLQRFKNKPFAPKNLRRDLEVVKQAAGYTGRGAKDPENELKPWPADVLRHTGISHFFRKSGSYGHTAEWAGNSESVIRKHYQGRVSSQDTKAFYAIVPKRVLRLNK